MSNQPENENQQTETITAEEMREYMLAEIEASKQAVAELSDEQLEEIVGGAGESPLPLAIRRPNPFESPQYSGSEGHYPTAEQQAARHAKILYGGTAAVGGTAIIGGVGYAFYHHFKKANEKH